MWMMKGSLKLGQASITSGSKLLLGLFLVFLCLARPSLVLVAAVVVVRVATVLGAMGLVGPMRLAVARRLALFLLVCLDLLLLLLGFRLGRRVQHS